MYIDSHAHLTFPSIIDQIDGLLERAQQVNIQKVINICTDELSLKTGIELHQRYPFVYNTAATTPHDVEKDGEYFFPFVKQAAQKRQLIAIGETGLDYYYTHLDRDLQQVHLLRYFELAKQVQLPIIFHCRDAFSDLFRLTDQHYSGLPAVLHCFTGTELEAKNVIDRGWYLSISGIVTFKKSEGLREVVSQVPLNRLLIETDTPYLAPQSRRGKQNEPAFIIETAAMVASILGKTTEEIGQITSENAERLFFKAFNKSLELS